MESSSENSSDTCKTVYAGSDLTQYLKPVFILPKDSCTLDELVMREMEQVRTTYEEEEAAYVKHQLQCNPIVEQRRPSHPGADERRAEACRRSRYNGKVKKASLRYKLQFISNSISNSSNVLKNMQELVSNLEKSLLADSRRQVDRTQLQILQSRCRLNPE